MKTKEEIKQVLKQMQVSFNPMKSTYRIIDKIVKNDLSSEEMLSYFSDIKGTEKYPKELKDQYDDVKKSLDNLIMMEKEAEEKAKQEETTKELKEIIDKLEANVGKKEESESSLDDLDKTEVIDLDFDEKEENKEDNKEASHESLEKEHENKIDKTDVKKESKEPEEDKYKGKKLFVFLTIMIFVLLVCGALILLFY